jgi:cation:H+ antiporter
MEHLIPEAWFIGLPQWALLLWCAGSLAVLVKGADWLVDGASGLAFKLGISKVIIGATVISLGTTAPECAVSVMAAWTGEPGLALGNAIGSIIADTGLIFGLGCLFVVLPADRYVLSRQGWVQFGAAALLAVICYASWAIMGDRAQLGRWVGLLFLGLLAVYMYFSVKWGREHPEGLPAVEDDAQVDKGSAGFVVFKLLLLCVVGLAMVILASRALINSVTELAAVHWHVPQVVISATVVALGTSMPLLVIGMASLLKGHKEILVGNIIGADILNVFFVVGASAAAAPLPLLEAGTKIPAIALLLHIPTMLVILVLFRIFIFRATKRGRFRRWYGLPLVLIYLAYTILQYVVT